MPTFEELNYGLYNAVAGGLGLSGTPFQLIQPSPPLLPDDHLLWNYLNNIPPKTLSQNMVQSGGNQFFSDYKALISALISPTGDRLVRDIGQDVLDEFIGFVSLKDPAPSVTRYPAIFRNWALLRHPSVANKGAADLAAMLLEPVAAAGIALMGYLGDSEATPPIPPRQPDWDENYNQLITLLRIAPSRVFSFNQHNLNSDVSNTWAGRSSSGFFGLWGGSSVSTHQSKLIAESNFSVEASFAHVLLFAPTPGDWYSSAAFGLAHSQRSGPPWDPTSIITWDKTFGPSGNMQYIMSNLVVVDTMQITVTSKVSLTIDDVTTIERNSGAGMWPFYSSNNNSGSSTEFKYDDTTGMTVTITSLPGIPIVIGGTVLPVSNYVGHSLAGARIFADLLRDNPSNREFILNPPEMAEVG
jgi:hypothetical protein